MHRLAMHKAIVTFEASVLEADVEFFWNQVGRPKQDGQGRSLEPTSSGRPTIPRLEHLLEITQKPFFDKDFIKKMKGLLKLRNAIVHPTPPSESDIQTLKAAGFPADPNNLSAEHLESLRQLMSSAQTLWLRLSGTVYSLQGGGKKDAPRTQDDETKAANGFSKPRTRRR